MVEKNADQQVRRKKRKLFLLTEAMRIALKRFSVILFDNARLQRFNCSQICDLNVLYINNCFEIHSV